MSGPIPPELGSLSKLIRLGLYDNQLTGGIPSVLSSLPNLELLNLSDNQLTAEIPSELGKLGNLAELYLGGSSQLAGCIPQGLRNVPEDDLGTSGLPLC